MYNIRFHIKNFNDRVKAMNQTHSRDLILSAQDARSLHADIFAVLALVTEMTAKSEAGGEQIVQISMDGGGFK
jgi:hypothetical protein